MKIAIPVETNSMETQICPSFGRAPYFMIFIPESQECCFIANEAAASPGGAGIKAAQIIVDSGAGVLLTPRCGRNAADVLVPSGIKIYKTVSALAQDNLKSFSEGALRILDDFHEGFHGRL